MSELKEAMQDQMTQMKADLAENIQKKMEENRAELTERLDLERNQTAKVVDELRARDDDLSREIDLKFEQCIRNESLCSVCQSNCASTTPSTSSTSIITTTTSTTTTQGNVGTTYGLVHYWPVKSGAMADVVGLVNTTSKGSPQFTSDRLGNANDAILVNSGTSAWTLPDGDYLFYTGPYILTNFQIDTTLLTPSKML